VFSNCVIYVLLTQFDCGIRKEKVLRIY